MNILEAWEIVNSHTFFIRPYKDSNGDIFSFEIEFDKAVYIFPLMDEYDSIYWLCEFGCFDLDSNLYYRDYDRWLVQGSSYEDCIIKLAKWLIENFGEDDYHNYYTIEDFDIDKLFTPSDRKGYVEFNSDELKSYWDEEVLIEKIKNYEK